MACWVTLGGCPIADTGVPPGNTAGIDLEAVSRDGSS